MAEQVAQLLDEKCKVLETLSKCQQEVGTSADLHSTEAKAVRSTLQSKFVYFDFRSIKNSN